MPLTIKFANRQVRDILTDIRANFESTREMGDNFERLFCEMAKRAPELEVHNIWQWSDWPARAQHGFSGLDDGVDLVAELTGGQLAAVQCKCYDVAHKVDKKDVQSFIVGAKPKVFPLRWFVATADYTPVAAKLLRENDVRVVDFQQYADLVIATVDDKPKREPLPLQQEAIDAVVQGFAETGRNRGRLTMACGTGKTFTSLRIAEQIAPSHKSTANILFIAPSIALVAQARREWLTHTRRPLACTVICSDRTAGRNSSEDIAANEISCEVTTDVNKIAADLNKPIGKGAARVVFCTYQSLDKLSEAQTGKKIKQKAPAFDLALIDEAHRTTGYLEKKKSKNAKKPSKKATSSTSKKIDGLFQLVHNGTAILADKRLYMTATPRMYDLKKVKKVDEAKIVDMNDTKTYGTEFYRLSFKKAVEESMLCDYRVIALGITENAMDAELKSRLFELNNQIEGRGREADDEAFLALGAIALAVNGIVKGKNAPGVLARTIAYASNIRRSKWLTDSLYTEEMQDWITAAHTSEAIAIHAKHLDGTSSALQRNAELRALNNDASKTEPHLISNAQLFTEGIDVPALNAIAFLDPRQSKVDTIQAVGRVMRRAEGKVIGYIVVPVILPPNKDLLEVLASEQSRFKSLGNVLRALQSHDERLYTELDERLMFGSVSGENGGKPPKGYVDPQTELLDADAKQAIYAQIAKKTGIAQHGKVLADAITQAIERAAELFKEAGATKIIADTIGTPSKNEKESCKTAALLIANACIMHKRLEETDHLRGLPKIGKAKLVPDPRSGLTSAWRTILEKDYEPVFQDATALLEAFPNSEKMRNAIDGLIQCAIDNATTLNDLGFDHAGPLYHKVLGTAQSDGAFYTKNLSGYLLAGLAFDENFTDWSDAEKVNRLRVIDPACGTGTLLMAALNIIKKRAAKAQNLTDDEVQKLHKRLVETGIYGFDINKYSVQLAACNLTIGAPNTDYERINLISLEHGPVKGKTGDKAADVRHGVLEKLLDSDDRLEILEPPPVYGESVTSREIKRVTLPTKFEAVICNPPFTDTSKQGKRYPKKVTIAMSERLKFIQEELEKREPATADVIAKRSVRPFFTPLATGLLAEEGGKLAEVVPATACTSANGRGERQYIADNYHIEMVVTSHDPKHVNFSENTNVHECLLVGVHCKNNTKPTRFIQLTNYPVNVESAEKLLNVIHNDKKFGGGGTTVKQFGARIRCAPGTGRRCSGLTRNLHTSPMKLARCRILLPSITSAS